MDPFPEEAKAFTLDDYEHWTAVYTELAMLKDELIATAEDVIDKAVSPHSREVLDKVDKKVLVAEQKRFLDRAMHYRKMADAARGAP